MTVKVPIRCHGCGQQGLATLDQVLASGACSCGSDDLEVDDLEATGAVANPGWPSDFWRNDGTGQPCRICGQWLKTNTPESQTAAKAHMEGHHQDPGISSQATMPGYDYFNDASILNAFDVHPDAQSGARCWCGAPATHSFAGRDYCEHHAAGALRQAKKAAWESDGPMDTLRDTQVVSQLARCSNCFHEFQVSVTDPAQPLPNCPSCGSTAVSAAGATSTYPTASKTAAEGAYVLVSKWQGGYVVLGTFPDSGAAWDYLHKLGPEAGLEWSVTNMQPPGMWNHGSKTAAGEPEPFECQECGARFKRKIGPRTSEVKCPKCGSYDTLPTNYFGYKDAASKEALSEGGVLTTLVNMVNYARSSGDNEIPGWFKKYFSRLLLPEEIASGHWEAGGGGGYSWGTMGAKLAAHKQADKKTNTGTHLISTVEFPPGSGYWETLVFPIGSWTEVDGTSRMGQEEALRYHDEYVQKYSSKQAVETDPNKICSECDGSGKDWQTGGTCSRCQGTGHRRASLDPVTAKVIAISHGIRTNNPGITQQQAALLAEQVIDRYPKMVLRTA